MSAIVDPPAVRTGAPTYDARSLFAALCSCRWCRLTAYVSHPERICARCGR